jgi:hypothetical protein
MIPLTDVSALYADHPLETARPARFSLSPACIPTPGGPAHSFWLILLVPIDHRYLFYKCLVYQPAIWAAYQKITGITAGNGGGVSNLPAKQHP